MKKLFDKDWFWLGLIILISLVIGFPLLKPGFYPFHDEAQIANLYEMIRAISGGQFPPRWAPDFSFNYGYPFFVFYYPLPFYLGSWFYFLFKNSLVWSLKLVFLFSLPLSGIFFYFLARKFFSRQFSFLATAVYLLTPYRAVDLYVRGAVGELWSFVFMPAVLLTFFNLLEKRNLRNEFLAGLSLAALILAHNLTAIIFLPFLAVFCFFWILMQKKKTDSFFSLAIGGWTGLAFSAYYWVPAVLEKKFIQTGTPFNPFDHFPFIRQLLIPSWGYGASVWGPDDKMSFQIGVVNLMAIVLGFLVFVWKKRFLGQKKLVLWETIMFSFAFSVFMMNIRSGFLWKILPLGEYVQFPWRFLLLTTLFSSLSIGFLDDFSGKIKKTSFVVILLLLSVLNLKYFKPEKSLLVNDNYYLERMFANRLSQGESEKVSEKYYNYSEDYLPLTIWTQKRPNSLPKSVLEVSSGQISFRKSTPTLFFAKVETSQPTKLIFHQYYFPGWQVAINGQKREININKPFGDIAVFIAPGKSDIKIWFGRSLVRLIAELITLIIFFVYFVLIFKQRLKK